MPAKKSVKRTNKNSPKKNSSKKVTTIRKRAFVMITGPKSNGDKGRVAQVVEYSKTNDRYALLLNNFGKFVVRNRYEVRKATDAEKRKDPKNHNKELTLDRYERAIFNARN